MMSTSVFLAVIAGCFLQINASPYFQCDSTIVQSIKSLWTDSSNNGILETAISYQSMALPWVTPSYLKSDVACCSTCFVKEEGNVFTTQYLHMNLNDYGQVRDTSYEVIEADGAIVDKDQVKKRYSVYSQNNVLACYVCLDSDSAPLGPPEGFIAVKQNDYTQEDLSAAWAALDNLGIKATDQYPDTCA